MESLPLIHRDISWLSFNYRVLQEAKDPAVPLLERLKFLAIYSSNLDEFFRIRVAGIRKLKKVGKKTKARLDFDPSTTLKEVHRIVNRHQEEFSQVFEQQIVPELRKHHIHILRRLDLNDEQKQFVENYFNENLLPFVMPVLLVKRRIRPFLANANLYLAVHLRQKKKPLSDSEYALVKIPSDQLPRFITLPSSGDRQNLILLDDIVRHSVSWLFPGYEIQDTYSIKLTRDAELYIDDEYSGDLVQKIKSSLQKRQVGPASRFVYDREMPGHLLSYLQDTFDLGKNDILPEGRYHNNFDFFKFPDFGMTHLKYKPLPPLPHLVLNDAEDPFAVIRQKDQLLHFPYHSYQSVVNFFEKAAEDPTVTHIKVIQYRVARRSRILESLMHAVTHGKQVSAFVEIKARFDEAANLEWGEKLERAGVRVHYSFPGVKVHSKLALVRRVENGQPQLYAYLGTGNFHEETAKIYSDFGIFTADPRLTGEVSNVFSFLENIKPPKQEFEHLLVGQFNLRPALYRLIDQEIAAAKRKKPAAMTIKINSIEDKEMIAKLYEASRAGVKIRLIVRGICCLIPGLKGVSENIEVVSIVDRFLEHARVFMFHNGGDERIYMSSADWMERNLSYRIETTFPVYDSDLKAEIKALLDLQLNDNVKARIIDKFDQNEYRRNSTDIPVRAQLETYFYFKRKAEGL
ncbi:MAG: polyphosphate kinase 1 [Saprospiraceae bacterium]|nr:polyphosphate kinase 1 [Saprospiraceae bacterium]MCB0542117.1 polyphosphate kinase 1 [Saprospiraceae bacterium]MCB9354534.1 polyphosphate kinase 1 [Lewinellaceae bacterium]